MKINSTTSNPLSTYMGLPRKVYNYCVKNSNALRVLKPHLAISCDFAHKVDWALFTLAHLFQKLPVVRAEQQGVAFLVLSPPEL